MRSDVARVARTSLHSTPRSYGITTTLKPHRAVSARASPVFADTSAATTVARGMPRAAASFVHLFADNRSGLGRNDCGARSRLIAVLRADAVPQRSTQRGRAMRMPSRAGLIERHDAMLPVVRDVLRRGCGQHADMHAQAKAKRVTGYRLEMNSGQVAW